MTGVLVLTVIIVMVIYIYMRHAAKRRRVEDMDFVKSYHDNYKRNRTRKNIQKTDNAYRTYVTKYNSTEDYREPRGR